MAERRADAAMYARVFEGVHAEGALVLEDLTRRFGGALFVKGGEEGRRETDYRLGRRAVLDFILGQINQANGAPPPTTPIPNRPADAGFFNSGAIHGPRRFHHVFRNEGDAGGGGGAAAAGGGRRSKAEQQRVLLALARQGGAAATVRQLALLEALGARLLPARLAAGAAQAVQVRLVELPLVPALPGVRTRLAPGEVPRQGADGKTLDLEASARR
jgi:hypothetical protein